MSTEAEVARDVAALAEGLRSIPVPESYDDWRAAVDRTYEADAERVLVALREIGWAVTPADNLSAAWAACEAALPEGWWLSDLGLDGQDIQFVGGRSQRVDFWTARARGPKDADQSGSGLTPAAALNALAAQLRDKAAGR